MCYFGSNNLENVFFCIADFCTYPILSIISQFPKLALREAGREGAEACVALLARRFLLQPRFVSSGTADGRMLSTNMRNRRQIGTEDDPNLHVQCAH